MPDAKDTGKKNLVGGTSLREPGEIGLKAVPYPLVVNLTFGESKAGK